MKREVGFRMLRTEEKAARDPVYQRLAAEYRVVSPRYIKTLDTLPPEKRAVIDHYGGLIGEMHRKMLELACDLDEE